MVEIEKILRETSSSGQINQPPNKDCNAVFDIQPPLALCGRVVNAIIWEENLWHLIYDENILRIGSFVRLRNINNAKLPRTTAGILHTGFSVHSKSSLTPLPFDAYEVKVLLRAHDLRIRRGDPPNPASAILPTTTGSSSIRITSRIRPDDIVVEQQQRCAKRLKDNNKNTKGKGGLSKIEECLRTTPPATFTTQFEISHTIPACSTASLSSDVIKSLCPQRRRGGGDSNSGTPASFRFALHAKDASSEMDVLCLGRVAEELLGIKARDINFEDDEADDEGRRRKRESEEKCGAAMAALREITMPGSVCEGKIRSIVGKDGKLYFILKSIFCITNAGPDDITI